MRIHPVDARTRDFWKSYPVRISGHSISECCGKPTLLVQSMEGGFVTRNCPQCGSRTTLTHDAFFNEIDLWVACPDCKQPMKRDMIDKNYGFVCEPCDVAILLAALLPRWEDLA